MVAPDRAGARGAARRLRDDWVIALAMNGLYRPRARWSIRREAIDVLRATVALRARHAERPVRLPAAGRQPSCSCWCCSRSRRPRPFCLRVVLRLAMERRRRQGKNLRFVLVLGAGPRGQAFARKLEDHRELGLRIAASSTTRPASSSRAVGVPRPTRRPRGRAAHAASSTRSRSACRSRNGTSSTRSPTSARRRARSSASRWTSSTARSRSGGSRSSTERRSSRSCRARIAPWRLAMKRAARPRRVRRGSRPAQPGAARHRARHQARRRRPDPVPAASSGPAWPPVRGRQVPIDARRCRGPPRRAGPSERGPGPCLQDHQRSRGSRGSGRFLRGRASTNCPSC